MKATFLLMAMLAMDAAAATFAEVAPILERRCQSCHRKGEIGKMPLVTYRDVRPWAKAIREKVLTRKMPPWFVESASVRFANDARLSSEEIATIAEWVRGGAREGGRYAPEAAPQRVNTAGVVLTMRTAVRVPARQELDYQYVDLPLGWTQDRWVRGAEIRPGARGVVHHAVLYVREPGSPAIRGVTKADILAIYAPGQPPMSLPEGMAKKVPAGSDLVLQLHYTPNGVEVEDRTSVALVFAAEAPVKRVLTLQIATTEILIPPRVAIHRVTAFGTLPNDALLLSLFPHLHLRGTAFEYSLEEAGGKVETLLRVSPYDFAWQLNYVLASPLLLRKGARLRATAWYDNSPNNPRNPDADAEVGYGERSRDEMMVGFFDVAVPVDIDKAAFFRR